MGSGPKKRGAPSAAANSGSKKRQKIKPVPTTEKKAVTVAVAVDALPWNEVKLPEMFDDAEGFFGLEEVEGVEVVREGTNLKFVSAKTTKVDDEEEFEGFGDDTVDTETASEKLDKTSNPTATQTPKEKQEKKSKKDKKTKKAKKEKPQTKTPLKEDEDGVGSSGLKPNVFEALVQQEDEGIDVTAWSELDVSGNILSALSKLGFAKPTLIQSTAIPEILAGHDVVGKASTGSGKTLAFAIPIVESWLDQYGELDDDELKTSRPPTALILSPTRELAHQLTEHITALCKSMEKSPWIATVTGGLSVQKQQRQLSKADIIIGTPGRLWEVMSSSVELSTSMKSIKFLVVDEADRLLTDGHFKEAEEILTALDRQQDIDQEDNIPTRQTLIFSATFAKGLQQKLVGKGKQGLLDDKESMEYLLKKLNFREDKPKFVDVNPISQMAEGLTEGLVECAGTEKDLYLYSLLLYHPNQRTLIFTNSVHSVHRLTPLLQALNIPVYALHSHMIQKARLRSIERFSSPKSPGSILVATDVAARGLDIGGVQLVIHYHLPRSADMYVHRSGRTARAEALGSSIVLCAPEEVVGMRRLVAKVHAQNAVAGGGNKSKYYMRSLDIDRKVVARLKPRVTLAKKIADSSLAKEKKGHDDDWVRNAAEELGVDYDSEEFEAAGGQRKGRGTGRKLKEKEARALTKNELGALRSELKSLLAQRVNVGVSERYLTAGSVDVNELLKGTKGEFLGQVDGIGME
ncbi:P-loop containing nucleoside triphosphate hydrolase protein [Amylocarpus encephaloides]|uniref:ATP-dependent RNA helicase n=1 Tax=Amylocarpus encephaloides TaxID=45428 RepID=A0A9P7YBL9_9HELO|nr:P-loop containing nucleoside triphosphate hydrolase protein [Amylocarpus encephaloides]